MSDPRYVVLTLSDAALIAPALRVWALITRSKDASRIAARLASETGADMQEIVDTLKGTEICAACEIEGQSASCSAIDTKKQGRRLQRLLHRALGVRGDPTLRAPEITAPPVDERLPIDPGSRKGQIILAILDAARPPYWLTDTDIWTATTRKIGTTKRNEILAALEWIGVAHGHTGSSHGVKITAEQIAAARLALSGAASAV